MCGSHVTTAQVITDDGLGGSSARFAERMVNDRWYVIDSSTLPALFIEMPSELNTATSARLCRNVLNALDEVARGYDVTDMEGSLRRAIEDQSKPMQEFLWDQLIRVTIIQPDRFAAILCNLVA